VAKAAIKAKINLEPYKILYLLRRYGKVTIELLQETPSTLIAVIEETGEVIGKGDIQTTLS